MKMKKLSKGAKRKAIAEIFWYFWIIVGIVVTVMYHLDLIPEASGTSSPAVEIALISLRILGFVGIFFVIGAIGALIEVKEDMSYYEKYK